MPKPGSYLIAKIQSLRCYHAAYEVLSCLIVTHHIIVIFRPFKRN